MEFSYRLLSCCVEDIRVMADLMLKDTKGECFSNKDLEGNIIDLKDMAPIYIEYAKCFVINKDGEDIGLISLTNDNEISIFIEPNYQGMHIGTIVLQFFMKDILGKYKNELTSLIGEIVPTNEASVKLFTNLGFKETDITREVPLNGINTLVKTYRYDRSC